jgi:GTP-binding protein HflX
VVDISHSGFEEQIEVVSSTLREIDDKDKPTIMVFNKVDAFSHIVKDEDDLTPATRANLSIDDLKKSWMAKETPSIFISALNKGNFDEFKEMLYKEVMKVHVTRFPYNDFLYTETGEEDIDD